MAQNTHAGAAAGLAAPHNRPNFDLMWRRFQDVAPVESETYPDGVVQSLQKVADRIGGHVKLNFEVGIREIMEDAKTNPDSYPEHPTGFTNACATRMSYLLNHCGVPIPKSPLWKSVTGADHKNYIYQVAGIRAFLIHTFGKPEIEKGPSARPEDFEPGKGIIVFDVDFPDASGHATLWNGSRAVDEDYFHPRPGAPLRGVKLWQCP